MIVLDPLEIDLPFLDIPFHFYPNEEDVPLWLHSLNNSIKESDALIFLSAEYNRSVPPAMVNLIDYVPFTSYQYKPVGIIGYSAGR